MQLQLCPKRRNNVSNPLKQWYLWIILQISDNRLISVLVRWGSCLNHQVYVISKAWTQILIGFCPLKGLDTTNLNNEHKKYVSRAFVSSNCMAGVVQICSTSLKFLKLYFDSIQSLFGSYIYLTWIIQNFTNDDHDYDK